MYSSIRFHLYCEDIAVNSCVHSWSADPLANDHNNSLLVVKIKALLLGCNSSTGSDIDTTQEVGQGDINIMHPVLS